MLVIRVVMGLPPRPQLPELTPEERWRRKQHLQRVDKWTEASHATTRRQRESGTYGPKWTTLRGWYAYEMRQRYKKATYKALGATLQLSATRVSQIVAREDYRRRCADIPAGAMPIRGPNNIWWRRWWPA